MIAALPVYLASAHLLIAAASNGVPTLNVRPSCQQAASGSLGLTQEFDACLKSENTAREELGKEWNTFTSADRASCLSLTRTGTGGSYTELLTCLEMKRDARKLPDDTSKTPASTVGQGVR
jgi:hypothetical protein